MNSAQLKEQQPVVWRMMSNALKGNRLSHAYLISGVKGTPKTETARLFVQSILCENPDEDGFACGQCQSCQQVEHGQSVNYEVLPKEKASRKEILALQTRMAQTTLDSSASRCYLIEDFDQIRNEAANALLKFFEEPQPGIHAFLTCTSKASILPTIVSRAQNLALRPIQLKTSGQDWLEKPEVLLTMAGFTPDERQELLDQPAKMEEIKQAALYFLKYPGADDAILRMQLLFKQKTEFMDRRWIRTWLQYVLEGLKSHQVSAPEEKNIRLHLAAVECMDMVKNNIDLALLLDQFYYKVRKVMME